MALVVTQAELRDLVRSPEQIRRAIDACEAGVRASHAGAAGQAIFGDLALEASSHMKLLAGAAPGGDMSVQVFPAQANEAFHADSRVMLLFDGTTGALKGLFAGDELAALRTSVPAALGARHLAPEGSRVLGILGSGYQAASHALTITAALPRVREILVWSPTAAHRERFAAGQSESLGLPVRACGDPDEVVRSADVLTAAGRTGPGEPAYAADWVKPGALVISMTNSAPQELHARARLIVPTRTRPELVAFGFTGVSAPRPVGEPDGAVELTDVIEGHAEARTHPRQPVIWELANVYLWDVAILAWAYEWAARSGVGRAFRLTSPLEPEHEGAIDAGRRLAAGTTRASELG